MVQIRANINTDLQTSKTDDFPALAVQPRPFSWSPLHPLPPYDLYTIPPSPPPEDMAGPARSAPDHRTSQPPRPPNAWIIYRSEQARNLPPLPPGVPRRAQAEVSRILADMWKNEPDHVRAEYERRADAKKVEHQEKYPGYRFHPMKKEDKDRLREELRQEKERDRAQSRRARTRPSPYATNFGPVSAPVPHPFAAYYHPEVRYGPAGPSPPLSAASSPNDASPYPDSQHGSDDQPEPQSTHASPHPDSYTNATSHPSSLPSIPASPCDGPISASHPLRLPSSSFPLDPGHPSIPGPNEWRPQQHPQVASGNAAVSPAPTWSNHSLSQAQLVPNGSASQDYVSFNVPPLATQPWISEEGSSEFEQSLQALLSATGDPSIFQLSNFDPHALMSHPPCEIEVSLGQLHFPLEAQPIQLSAPDFSNFDFGSLSRPSSDHTNNVKTGHSSVDQAADLASFFPGHAIDLPPSSTSENVDFSNYLNFDDVPPDVTPSRPPPLRQSQLMQSNGQQVLETAAVPSTPYVPPAGAAYSSTRRVGASWKPSIPVEPNSPIDHSPPRQWGVSAG